MTERTGGARQEGVVSERGDHGRVGVFIASGDEAAIWRRLDQHFQAGADHVCVQALRADGAPGPDVDLLERLAPGGIRTRNGTAPDFHP